jgi:hypothetical protein
MSEQEQQEESVESTEGTPAAAGVAETPAAQGEAAANAAAAGSEDLAKVRELVLKAHPDVVPDLVQGSSVDELIASVEPARSAYQRVADAVRAGATESGVRGTEETTEAASPPVVPAGGATNIVDPSSIPPTGKIARGLAEQKRKSA